MAWDNFIMQAGLYTLHPRSCYQFERKQYKYDTSAPRVLDLTATHYMVNVTVQATSLPAQQHNATPAVQPNITLRVQRSQTLSNQKNQRTGTQGTPLCFL